MILRLAAGRPFVAPSDKRSAHVWMYISATSMDWSRSVLIEWCAAWLMCPIGRHDVSESEWGAIERVRASTASRRLLTERLYSECVPVRVL